MTAVELDHEINILLDRTIADPEEWIEYMSGLMNKCSQLGDGSITDQERYLASAYSFDTCIQSSGLFSYFELAPHWAQHGAAAMRFLDLPIMEKVVKDALAEMQLSEASDEDAIVARIKGKFLEDEASFGALLDALRPLEDIYYQNDSTVFDAVVGFIQQNRASLIQTNSNGRTNEQIHHP